MEGAQLEPLHLKACVVHKGHAFHMQEKKPCDIRFFPQQEKFSTYLINSARAVDIDQEGALNDPIGSFPAQRLAAGA